ncbi:hypothetical protein Dolphis_58 [Pseudomonas phage Dolphis]|nr:hypothetical protein Dolphis_58 [Pseudomonas phage Dolphis]
MSNKTPEELRQQARDLREAAAYAERASDGRADRERAQRLEEEANRLEQEQQQANS